MKPGRVFRKMTGGQCQCPTCGVYFNSDAAFDKHRTGTIGKSDRRCLTIPEMLEAGMAKNSGDWWVTKPYDGWLKKPSGGAKDASEGAG